MAGESRADAEKGEGPEEVKDGRVRRGARSREAIVNALYGLLAEGSIQPTAEQVADRAGVQVRTVFRHFSDMESLHVELTNRLRDELQPIIDSTPLEGGARERMQELVRRRSMVFERLAPFKRSANTVRWRYDYLQGDHETFIRRLRNQLHAVFPELNSNSAAAAAIELVTSFEAWERLRVDQRLGLDRARAVVEHAAIVLLESE
jgi:AcrR family transcriptional regulator